MSPENSPVESPPLCPSSPQAKELEEQGWIRQNTIDEPRLSELVELYNSLGFEVCLVPHQPAPHLSACQACLLASPERYKTIYTRRPPRPEKQ